MIRDSYEGGNDGALIEHYDMNDIDPDTLRRYRTLFQFRNEGHVWNEVDDKTFLKNLGGYIVDRETGKEGLTMAGLMMFGKGLSVRDRFDNIRMDYIDKTNLIGDSRWSDRLTYEGTWENNRFNFFTRVMPKLTADLKHPFKLEGMDYEKLIITCSRMPRDFSSLIAHVSMVVIRYNILALIKRSDDYETIGGLFSDI